MKTEYSNVIFPPGVIVHGTTTRAISVKSGVKLTRVTEDGRDDLVVDKAGREPFVIAWCRINGGVQAPAPKAKK